jgi:hypothetical protein
MKQNFSKIWSVYIQLTLKGEKGFQDEKKGSNARSYFKNNFIDPCHHRISLPGDKDMLHAHDFMS